MAEPNVHLHADEQSRPARRPWPRLRKDTILAFTIGLLLRVDKVDADGREIGFDYESIRRSVLKAFPVVTHSGPHKGKPVRMTFHYLQRITSGLNSAGVRLPARPGRSRKSKRKTP